MTATSSSVPPDAGPDAGPGAEPGSGAVGARGVPFARLLRVETRKLFDTRAGLVLTAVLVVLSPALVVARSVATGVTGFLTLAVTAGIALGILLPVLGVLTITGEWTHRTALTTFTLEPRRGRVLAAKCLSTLAAAVVAGALCLVIAAVATAVHGEQADWGVTPMALLGRLTTMLILTAQGLAMGLLLLNAPAAIVICLVSPMVWSLVANVSTVGETLAAWLDLGVTTGAPASGGMTGGEAARLATSVLAWIVVPLVVGAVRVIRADVR